MADIDEPLSEATLSIYLRNLVQAEIDRSFKLGLTGAKPESQGSQAQIVANAVKGQAGRRL